LASSHVNKVYHACPQSSSTGGGAPETQLPSTDLERDLRRAKRTASRAHWSSTQRLKQYVHCSEAQRQTTHFVCSCVPPKLNQILYLYTYTHTHHAFIWQRDWFQTWAAGHWLVIPEMFRRNEKTR
jgi:hypothetical protein